MAETRQQRESGTDVSAFLGVLRRRFPIIVAAIVVAAAAAYFISDSQETKYEATTKLLLESAGPQTPQNQVFNAPVPETAPDREDLMLAGGVLERTRERLARRIGEKQAAEVVGDLTAFSGTDSTVVELTATASTPEAAALAANTLAQSNIDIRRETTVARIRRAQRAAERQLERLGSVAENPDQATTISALATQVGQFQTAAETNDGDASIVTEAAPPTSPSSPKPERNALIGGFAGLLIGLALALAREQMDRRMRQPKDLEEVFGLPVLASVPKSRALASQNGAALQQLPGPEAEAFQILRANLRYLSTERELRSVVVTSTGVGDGKSTVALNLAKADAIAGRRVLLVEADVRRPRLATMLGIQGDEGMTAFLSDRSKTLVEVTRRVPVEIRANGAGRAPGGDKPVLDVVVAGQVPENPSGLIDSERMRQLIREAEASYDLVVIDTAPAAMVADPIPLMSEATAVVIVGRVGKITSGEADALRETLERIDAPSYGLVANFAAGSGARYGYGYY